MSQNTYKVAKVVDQLGWAYYFLDKEQQRYSKHAISVQKHNEVRLDGLNAIYIHGPDISPEALEICLKAKSKGVKVIGGHAGPVVNMPTYPYLDLAVGISPQTFNFCVEHYDCPTVFLPEGIDTNFFRPTKRPQPIPTLVKGKWRCANEKLPLPRLVKRNYQSKVSLAVGWAGRRDDVKRLHLLEQLDYTVEIQSQHGPKYFVDRTLDHMLRFYNSIDVLVMTSLSECMPRVVLEACACGIPVVCTDVGSIRMILDPEWIVPVNPEQTVVDEMNKRLYQLEDRELRSRVGLANRQRVDQTLSWQILSPYWDAAFAATIEGDFDTLNRVNNHFGVRDVL